MKPINLISGKKVIDHSDELEYLVKEIAKTKILVGIPHGGKGDQRQETGAPSNAELGFLHEFGSPVQRIPERPFLQPAIEQKKPAISAMLRDSAKELLEAGNIDRFNDRMEMIALGAASAVKEYMTTADFQPLSDYTKEQRLKRHPGDNPDTMRPLIDTGSLRGAIDGLVVKE